MNLQQAIETGFAYHREGNLDAAEQVYDQLLCQIDKPEPNVFFGLGTLLISQQKYGQGIIFLQAAAHHSPNYAPIWTNLACAYKHLGKDDLALTSYDKANTLEPDHPDILAGIAGFWINKGEAGKVVEYATRALAIDQNHAAAHMHLGLGLLEQGRFEEAWPHYEYRWETIERVKDKRPYKAPMWEGDNVRTLAIHGEQGLGDEILFMSLLNVARQRANQVVVECAERLIPTFKATWPSVQFFKDHASLMAYLGKEPDAYIPMGSLPRILGLPDGKPFLKRNRIRNAKRPLVGIAWKGGTLRTNVHDRTVTLEQLRPILAIPDVEFCSVQYGSDLGNELVPHRLNDLPTDFDSLQNRIADCDLVITVCQTALHQAGAMGVDCWVLTPHRAPWVCSGNDLTPWYNSVSIVRQGPDCQWGPVIERAAHALKDRYASLAA